MKRITLFLSLLSLLLIGVLTGCGAKESSGESENKKRESYIDQIKKKDKITIGIFTDKPPFGYVNEKGENDGFEIALAKRITKDLLGDENKVEFVPVEPANRIPYLQSDKVDLILANMTVTDERKEAVDFTNPYLKVAIQLLVKDSSDIQSIDDLKGKKVIVTKGTTADIFFTKNYPDIELEKYDQVTESFQALKDDRGAAYVNDNLLLFDLARETPGFKVVNEKLEDPSPIAPAVKKGNKDLETWVNEEFEKLSKEGYLLELYDQYLKEAFGDNVKNPADIIVEGE
ncbi:transporter substrate-binding domain-containing protein [Metabacillus fastidiosus]|uniref:transporter substrate-binding domain-containing protein n=1 Tax=Metabacillus fastidiosus TaxID=1458 RepID=UPI003D268C72